MLGGFASRRALPLLILIVAWAVLELLLYRPLWQKDWMMPPPLPTLIKQMPSQEEAYALSLVPESLDDHESRPPSNCNGTEVRVVGYVSPPIIYGHVHIAKTAGTVLNGMLAAKYERICGHKGYSFDSYQHNLRHRKGESVETVKDSTTKGRLGFNRGRVIFGLMDERGYEDCDWISNEIDAAWWGNTFESWKLPMEIHLPCREPIDHLMSQCNHRTFQFDCTGDMIEQIKKCILHMERFGLNLEGLVKKRRKMFALKCFDYDVTFTKYMDLMDKTLQTRRLPSEYMIARTNSPRNRTEECIWEDVGLQKRVTDYMLNEYDYYRFCSQCIGSPHDLFS